MKKQKSSENPEKVSPPAPKAMETAAPLKPPPLPRVVVLDGTPVPEDVAEAVLRSRGEKARIDPTAEALEKLDQLQSRIEGQPLQLPPQPPSQPQPPGSGSPPSPEKRCVYEVFRAATVAAPGGLLEVLVPVGIRFGSRWEAEDLAAEIAVKNPGKAVHVMRCLRSVKCEVQKVSKLVEL